MLQGAESPTGVSSQLSELEAKLKLAMSTKGAQNGRAQLQRQAAEQCAGATDPAQQQSPYGWSQLGWQWYDNSKAWQLQFDADPLSYSRLINRTCTEPIYNHSDKSVDLLYVQVSTRPQSVAQSAISKGSSDLRIAIRYLAAVWCGLMHALGIRVLY